jgi:peptidoglycan/LPS O-acetylase OafA/YrhL
MSNDRPDRLLYLDGLRGIASVAVFFWHNFLAFFPGAVDKRIPIRVPWLEADVYRSPLAVLFAGDFAVYIFFVLSGFVISVRFFVQKDPDRVRKSYLRRYIRLMPPAACTVFVAYLLLSIGWMYNREAADLANSWWLALHWSDVTNTAKHAAWTAFYGIWFVGLSAQTHFNSNLGTLLIELVGSYIIFSYLTFAFTFMWSFTFRTHISLFMIIASFFLLKDDPHYTVFFVGMLLADLYANKPEVLRALGKLSYVWLIVGIFLGSSNIGNIPTMPYHVLEIIFRAIGLHPLSNPWALGSVCIVLAALTSPLFQKFLETKFCQCLGNYSFALFVCHTVFLGSFTCWIFVKLINYGYSYEWSVLISFVVGLPLLFVFVYGIRLVDKAAVRLSRKL